MRIAPEGQSVWRKDILPLWCSQRDWAPFERGLDAVLDESDQSRTWSAAMTCRSAFRLFWITPDCRVAHPENAAILHVLPCKHETAWVRHPPKQRDPLPEDNGIEIGRAHV